MSNATYRIGGASTPTACVRHPTTSVAFQCQECLDSLCQGCRAPGRENRCVVCHEAIEQRRLGLRPETGDAPPRSRWRGAIVVLTVTNILLGATWTGSHLLSSAAPVIGRSLASVEAVAALIERARDSAGLVPTDLTPILRDLPSEVAERVRDGAIRYHPSRDRQTFELSVTFGEGQ